MFPKHRFCSDSDTCDASSAAAELFGPPEQRDDATSRAVDLGFRVYLGWEVGLALGFLLSHRSAEYGDDTNTGGSKHPRSGS